MLLDAGYERVAILDWDVHHGHGTQAAVRLHPKPLVVMAGDRASMNEQDVRARISV